SLVAFPCAGDWISRPRAGAAEAAARARGPFRRCCRLGRIPIMNEAGHPPDVQQARLDRSAVVLPGRAGARRASMRLLGWFLVLGAGSPSGLAQESAAAARGLEIRPIAVWPTGPLEVIATFDRPIDPSLGTWFIGRLIPYLETP